MKWKKAGGSLFLKFVLTSLLLGLLPTILLSLAVFGHMFPKYRESIVLNYEQVAQYINDGIENAFAVYDDITKQIYHSGLQEGADGVYNRYDNLRQMLNGENTDIKLENFLKSLSRGNEDIYAVHFIGYTQEGEEKTAHTSAYSGYFRDEEGFRKSVGFDSWDRESSRLILVLPHQEGYFGSIRKIVTVGRNYFDIRGELSERTYVGTVFLDIDAGCMERLIRPTKFRNGESVMVVDAVGNCIYSNQEGEHVMPDVEDGEIMVRTRENAFGLSTVVRISEDAAFSQLSILRNIILAYQVVVIFALALGAVYFSRKLTRPVYDMMAQMAQVETGHFDLQLHVRSEDEIGILARRFNRMSQELKRYIDKSYAAQVKQYEAELNALKSQIYPHFLYNTLEIIRMTALEEESGTTAQMIEALAQQLRYLIGTVRDLVPLEQELECVTQYVRLLNFRIREKITLRIASEGSDGMFVPKLILQPVVENAYVHGLKPAKQSGVIRIEAVKRGDHIEICVLDNGVGMSSEALKRLKETLDRQQMGEKTEDGWRHVGLKNVHDRIRLLYGEQYGLHITSTAGLGTMVSILIPDTQEGMEGNDD